QKQGDCWEHSQIGAEGAFVARAEPATVQDPGGTSTAQRCPSPGATMMRIPEQAAAAARPPVPPSQAESAAPRGSDYAELSRLVKQAGLLERRRWDYIWRITVAATLLVSGWVVFVLVGDSWWQMAVAAFLAVMFTQLGFLGHDAG